MDCMQCPILDIRTRPRFCFNTASGMDCMQLLYHPIKGRVVTPVSIPQAVWIACNDFETAKKVLKGKTRFNTASGMDCMQFFCTSLCDAQLRCFNTASGMDCMQYRPSQPLGQLNPEAGFLNGSLFLANRRNLAGFFCRQNRLKTSANPVIPRKLLSTGKI